MRTIKFRAWDKEENKWLPEDKIAIDNYGNVYIAISEIGETVSVGDNDILWKFRLLTNSDRFIKVQFTGLKDKNGKEIYEGDICRVDWKDKRYKPHNVVVEFNQDEAQFVLGEGANTKYDAENYFEVIGNIYENPELLK